MWGALELGLANARRGDDLIRFGVDRLLTTRKGEQAKSKGEILKKVFF
jgi:hypothetical protein